MLLDPPGKGKPVPLRRHSLQNQAGVARSVTRTGCALRTTWPEKRFSQTCLRTCSPGCGSELFVDSTQLIEPGCSFSLVTPDAWWRTPCATLPSPSHSLLPVMGGPLRPSGDNRGDGPVPPPVAGLEPALVPAATPPRPIRATSWTCSSMLRARPLAIFLRTTVFRPPPRLDCPDRPGPPGISRPCVCAAIRHRDTPSRTGPARSEDPGSN